MNKEILTQVGPTEKANPLRNKEMGTLDMTPTSINSGPLGEIESNKIASETLTDEQIYEEPILLTNTPLGNIEHKPNNRKITPLGDIEHKIDDKKILDDEEIYEESEMSTKELTDDNINSNNKPNINNEELGNIYVGSNIERKGLDDINLYY